ncbi:MAG: hypothetical protein A4E62_03142 [Syntrophorhabdus sp. PtaU1.Bin002]|nr:MAG: hypothetical protein A4E62_03142 [Syntrophorhabdus sp. PtaU1.Bin002]
MLRTGIIVHGEVLEFIGLQDGHRQTTDDGGLQGSLDASCCFDELLKGDPEGVFIDTGPVYAATDAEELKPVVVLESPLLERVSPFVDDKGNRRQRFHIIDDGRTPV